MAAGTPCTATFFGMNPQTGNCDAHFTWLKKIPAGTDGLIETMQQPIAGLEGFTSMFGDKYKDGNLFANSDDAQTWLLSWLICATLLFGAWVARMGLNRAIGQGGTLQYVPDGSLTIRNLFELLTGSLYGLCVDLLGEKNAGKFFWLSAGLFIYILSSNLLGVVPGMLPPSGSMHHNCAMALVVLILFNGAGIKVQGIGGYLKHMWGPVWWLGALLFSIELLSFFLVRPYSLSLRLTGNMFGDHQVLSIMSGLIPVIYPMIFLALGMFVSFIQAFVFTLLSTIYIALAVEHNDDH